MKGFIIYISVFLCVWCIDISGSTVSAETVSQKDAKEYAQRFFNIFYNENVAPVKLVYNGKKLTTNRLFTPFYVYNEPRGGYVIISAENKVFPILGYSLSEEFNPNAIGEAETELLRNFALDIEEIRYDSNVPEQAIDAWRDFDAFCKSILGAPHYVSENRMTKDEANEVLTYLWTTDAGLDSYADLYTPSQWQEMVDLELKNQGSAAIGYIFNDKLSPAVIYGKKGDYYQINLDGPNETFMRLMAGEIKGDRQLLSTLHPTYQPPVIATERPFAFYDDFVRSLDEEKASEDRRMSLEESKPLIKEVGGGHFDVILPEDITLAMIYNVGGSMIGRNTYKGSNVAHINIEAEPNGFYFALILGESGRPYGIKLYR